MISTLHKCTSYASGDKQPVGWIWAVQLCNPACGSLDQPQLQTLHVACRLDPIPRVLQAAQQVGSRASQAACALDPCAVCSAGSSLWCYGLHMPQARPRGWCVYSESRGWLVQYAVHRTGLPTSCIWYEELTMGHAPCSALLDPK